MAPQTIHPYSDAFIQFLYTQSLFTIFLFSIVFVVTRLRRKPSPIFHLGLWGLIFIRLLLPTGLSHSLSARMLFQPLIPTIDAISLTNINAPFELQNNANTQIAASTANEQTPSFLTPSILFMGLWGCGFSLLCTFFFITRQKFKRLVRNSPNCSDERIDRLLEKWKNEFNIHRTIRIVTGSRNAPPFTFGLLKPVIYLPLSVCNQCNAKTIESILAHEIAHIKNLDDLWIRLQNAIQIFYFFNPLVWLAGGRLSHSRELLCDDLVISKQTIAPREYGNGLLTIIQMNLKQFNQSLFQLPALFGEKKRLFERINNIKQSSQTNRQKYSFNLFFLVMLSFFILPMGYTEKFREPGVPVLQSPIPQGFLALEYGMDFNQLESRYEFHNGVDITLFHKSQMVSAAADGAVISTGIDEIRPECREVTIRHSGGLVTRYLHLNSILVKPNQPIKQGDSIGNAPQCVHFEVYQDGVVRDPEDFLSVEKKLIRPIIKTHKYTAKDT